MGAYQIIMIILFAACLLGLVAWAVIYFLFYSEKTEKIYITALRKEGESFIADYYIKSKKDKLTYTKKVSEKIYNTFKIGRAYNVRFKGRKISAVLKESIK